MSSRELPVQKRVLGRRLCSSVAPLLVDRKDSGVECTALCRQGRRAYWLTVQSRLTARVNPTIYGPATRPMRRIASWRAPPQSWGGVGSLCSTLKLVRMGGLRRPVRANAAALHSFFHLPTMSHAPGRTTAHEIESYLLISGESQGQYQSTCVMRLYTPAHQRPVARRAACPSLQSGVYCSTLPGRVGSCAYRCDAG